MPIRRKSTSSDTCLADASLDVLWRLDENVLTRRLIADPAVRRSYFDALRRASGYVNARYLVPVVDQTYQQIHTAVLADDKKPLTNEDFENVIVALKATIAARASDILAQLP